jgi:hypothetical protein
LKVIVACGPIQHWNFFNSPGMDRGEAQSSSAHTNKTKPGAGTRVYFCICRVVIAITRWPTSPYAYAYFTA